MTTTAPVVDPRSDWVCPIARRLSSAMSAHIKDRAMACRDELHAPPIVFLPSLRGATSHGSRSRASIYGTERVRRRQGVGFREVYRNRSAGDDEPGRDLFGHDRHHGLRHTRLLDHGGHGDFERPVTQIVAILWNQGDARG